MVDGIPSHLMPTSTLVGSGLVRLNINLNSSPFSLPFHPRMPMSPASDLFEFDRLPVEIARLIFEYAASESRSTSYKLICVSKAVKQWILPLLYQHVILETPMNLFLFCNAVSHLKSRPGNHTKVLYIPHCQHPMIKLSFLVHFPALEYLAMNSSLLNYPSTNLDPDSYPCPTSISMTGSLKRAVFDHPLFRCCTHLYFPDDLPSASYFKTDFFPHLTHLACAYRHGRSSTTAFTCLPLLLSSHKLNLNEFNFIRDTTNSNSSSSLSALQSSTGSAGSDHVELEVLIVDMYMSNGSPDEQGFVLQRLGLGVPANQRRICDDPRLFLRPGEHFTTARWERDIVNQVMWVNVEQHIESRRRILNSARIT